MSDNVQTAAVWQQTIDNLDQLKKTALFQKAQYIASLKAQYQELNILQQQQAAADIAGQTANVADIQNKINSLTAQIQVTTGLIANSERDIVQIDADLVFAFQQKSIAEAGPPRDNSNTPPIAVVPGESNSSVTLEKSPPIENPAPAAISQPRSFPAGQNDILDGGIPASGDNTIQNPAPVTVNANTRPNPDYELVFDPVNIDPNSDPLEEARYQAGLRFDEATGRTEQDIIGAYGGMQGLQGSVDRARSQQTLQDAENAKTQGDWRVRLSLAPTADYLYKAINPGILAPLQKTLGVIFPYLPQIQVTYAANYETADIVHTNYKMIQYKNSAVDQITITGDFTAQDTNEADYLLAVIHFFRTVTKMFYGKDQIPKPGTPPPLCYLSGLGDFQFDKHPLVVSSFNYSLPNDVDYIRASSPTLLSGVNSTAYNNKGGILPSSEIRMKSSPNPLNSGATVSLPVFENKATNTQPTYVPTKMSISITAFPIVTRNNISNRFSVKDYATGALLQGSKNPSGGGIW